jgi:hypothetical protein
MTCLDWREEKSSMDIPTYVADVPWRGLFEDPQYRVYSWKDGWAYSRPEHPILGKLDGRVADIHEAQRLCEEDFAKQQRLRHWREYMLTNEPPDT